MLFPPPHHPPISGTDYGGSDGCWTGALFGFSGIDGPTRTNERYGTAILHCTTLITRYTVFILFSMLLSPARSVSIYSTQVKLCY